MNAVVFTKFISLAASIAGMTAIVALRYLFVSGAFAFATRLKHHGLYAGQNQQMKREILWSLASALVYAVPAGIVAWGWQRHGWTLIYTDLHAMPLWYLPVSLFAFLAIHDTWFYWSHRWMHEPRIFKIFHAVHHESRTPTAWAAMSFHWTEALTGAFVIPLLVFLIPIHISMLAVVLSIMTVMGVGNHMGWEMFPKWLVHGPAGRWLITATHHQKHHTAYRGNYGLYFRFWDKICGTDLGLGTFRHPDRQQRNHHQQPSSHDRD